MGKRKKDSSGLPLITRRDFIKGGVAAGVVLAVSDLSVIAAEAGASAEVWVIHGKNKVALMKKAVEIIKANGGFGTNVKNMTLKVNAGWDRTPEEGANTHPELVGEFLRSAKADGIKVVLPEHSCDNAKASFVKSGIYAAAKANGFEMIDLGSDRKSYKDVEIPGGKTLKKDRVSEYFISTDCVVNMPVAKNHGGATLSMAMKNWMGVIDDRRYWHNNNLHQCIADFCTFMKPSWTIIDATRTMMDKGPKGPGTLKYPDLLIVSRDQVAADAYAATLFFDSPDKVKYIKIAGEMGIGAADLNRIKVNKLEA
jgi:uncharacterized protein (DUF362 family)